MEKSISHIWAKLESAENAFLSRLLDQMVMCGQKAASRLGSECTPGQVHDSLTATPEMIRFETMVPFSNGIDPPVCTGRYQNLSRLMKKKK